MKICTIEMQALVLGRGQPVALTGLNLAAAPASPTPSMPTTAQPTFSISADPGTPPGTPSTNTGYAGPQCPPGMVATTATVTGTQTVNTNSVNVDISLNPSINAGITQTTVNQNTVVSCERAPAAPATAPASSPTSEAPSDDTSDTPYG